MQFRQKALAKLRSPEELDLPVRLARPQGRLVLTVTVLVMAAASVWAVTGTVSTTLRAPGVLTHAQGSYVLQSPYAGQVTDVLAREGVRLAADAPLVKIRTAQGDKVVRTIAAGRITGMAVAIGAVVRTGADVATVERVESAADPLLAVLYVPAGSAATVPVGAAVDVTVQSVPASSYGTVKGTVQAVGRSAQTQRQITAFLGDGELSDEFSRGGAPVAVLVRLAPAPDTKSGYRWSSPQGPPYALDSMVRATGAVRLAERRPIDWLLP
ncbi:HlyD family efflux transporter periplasmic adaptor subunit [Streptomyces sp. NPDC091292]|uniref:HlyD family efflux transporter periplasmic adaptor subunit n=1 Tax=Streptomyces sp. NPDC091292 TaxID=3365991 RepID=UPI003829FA70